MAKYDEKKTIYEEKYEKTDSETRGDGGGDGGGASGGASQSGRELNILDGVTEKCTWTMDSAQLM